MKTMVDAYFWLLRAVIAVLLAAMVVLVFGNVVLRYGFNACTRSSSLLNSLTMAGS